MEPNWKPLTDKEVLRNAFDVVVMVQDMSVHDAKKVLSVASELVEQGSKVNTQSYYWAEMQAHIINE